MNLELTDHYFNHDGLKLHYWEWGDPNQETFVFVHGVRDQGRSWDDFIAAMIARGLPIKHAVAIDLRGHGDGLEAVEDPDQLELVCAHGCERTFGGLDDTGRVWDLAAGGPFGGPLVLDGFVLRK